MLRSGDLVSAGELVSAVDSVGDLLAPLGGSGDDQPAGDRELPPAAGSAGLLGRAAQATSTHLLAVIGGDGTILDVSESVARLLGHPRGSLIATSCLALIHPDDLAMAISMLAGEGRGPDGDDDADVGGEYRLRHRDGRWIPFEVFRDDLRDDPDVGALMVVARPVVVRRALDDALTALAYDEDGTHALRQLASYLDVRIPATMAAFLVAGPDGMWVTERVPGRLLAAGGPWQRAMTTGASVLVGAGTPLREALDPVTAAAAEERGVLGCWCLPVPISRARVYRPGAVAPGDESALGCLVVWSHRHRHPLVGHLGAMERAGGLAEVVLRRRATTLDLRHRAAHDPLTGVLSRAGLESRVPGPDCPTVLVVDIDDFKQINDHHGHPVGDRALRATAERIQRLLREGDVLARLGGDEFVVQLRAADLAEAVAVAERIVAATTVPVGIEGVCVEVATSVGIAPPDPEASYEELLDRADRAMYRAKRAGKGCLRVWVAEA